jgi:hypothetical protein
MAALPTPAALAAYPLPDKDEVGRFHLGPWLHRYELGTVEPVVLDIATS